MKKQMLTAIFVCLGMIWVFAMIGNFVSGHTSKSEIKVGFVYIGDESNAYAYNFIRAQHQIENTYGDRVRTLVKYNVPENEVEAPLRELAQAGCNLIFATSYGYTQAAKAVAQEYPDIEICVATGDNANTEPVLKNFHTFMGEVYEGRYISGVVAGLKLQELIKSGRITPEQALVGYVGAYPYPEVISGYTAFLMGIRSIVPDATMRVCYADTWSSYSKEKELAKKLIEEGCVIVSEHSDTAGAAVACEEMSLNKTVFHVGYNQSMTDVAPSTSLISCRINWSVYELAAVEAVLQGEPIEKRLNCNVYGQDAWAGFDKNWVQMLDLNEVIAADGTRDVMEAQIAQMKKGKTHVFYGDYTGYNPADETDRIDLHTEFIENEKSSSPAFHYLLDGIITIEETGDN